MQEERWLIKSEVSLLGQSQVEDCPKKELPTFHKEEDVEKHLPIIEAKYNHKKLEKEKRESWRDKYNNFDALIEEYKEFRIETAPNSWKQKIFDF